VREATVETRGVGEPYQTVVKFGSWGLRIHIFWRGDADADCHDHPADFWTFPLTSYVEEYRIPGHTLTYKRVVRAFRLHRRRAEFAHRLLGRWTGATEYDGSPQIDWETHEPVVSLVWWGKKRREWGFHTPEGWVHWKTYTSTP
jgi:hypothetical protein